MDKRPLNELIALERGWFPPGSPEHDARLASGPCPIGGRRDDWVHANGKSMEGLRRYDTDPAAAMELMTEDQSYWTIVHHKPDYLVLVLLHGNVSLEHRYEGRGTTLPAAIAEAYWRAVTKDERERQ